MILYTDTINTVLRLLCLVVGLAVASPGRAQEQVQMTDPIIVTLSALPFPLSMAPGSVTVVDRAAIEASRAATLEDVLRAAPFVDLSRPGGRGGLSTISLRGGDPNFTLVLLDGVPVNDPTNVLGGSFDFATLSADNVERVEIVRGPLSSRFGSEAMSGVINVVSRTGRDPGWSTEAAAGTFHMREGRLGARGAHGIADVSASASWIEMDEQVERDPYRLATAALAAGLTGRMGELRLSVRLHDVEAEGFPENGGGPRYSILRETRLSEARELMVGLEARRAIRSRWSVSAAADAYRRNGEVRSPRVFDEDPPGPNALPAFDQETDLDRRRLSLTSAWSVGGGVSVVASGELRREQGASDATIAGEFPADFDLERTTRAGGAELAWQSEHTSVDLALRVDAPEGFPSEASPRAAVAWRPASGTRLAASWGEGFKLPSFFSLGEPNVGNPELGPERSRGWDVGVTQEIPAAGLTLSLTGFRQRYRDLIDFSPEAFRLVNRRLARTAGLEAEAAWRPRPAVALTAFARWLDADIEGTDEPLRDRPRWRGGATLDWDVGPSHARLEAVWVGDRFDFQIPVPERDVAASYWTASLAASRRFADFMAFARVDNLFDADYQEFVGFPTPGRALRLGLRYAR